MNEEEFTIPFKVKWTPFKRCEECEKRKLNISLYEIHDTGLNCHITAYICKKCLKEAKKRCQEKEQTRWCACGDEILIEGDKCEVCKFMEEEKLKKRG